MSLQIDIVKSSSQTRRAYKGANSLGMEKIFLLIFAAIVVAMAFILGSLIAHFDSKTKLMAKKKEAIISEIKGIEREIDNTKLKIEKAKGYNIQKQIVKLGIGLRLPKWGQLRMLEPRKEIVSPAPKNMNVAQRKSGKGG